MGNFWSSGPALGIPNWSRALTSSLSTPSANAPSPDAVVPGAYARHARDFSIPPLNHIRTGQPTSSLFYAEALDANAVLLLLLSAIVLALSLRSFCIMYTARSPKNSIRI